MLRFQIQAHLRSWEAGESSKRKSYLPTDKQYLVTRNVPCLRRAISVEEEYEAAGGEVLLDDDDNDDGWLATHGRPKETTHDDSDENLPSMESLEISKGRAILSIPSYFGGEEEDVPDMAEYEDSESLVETDPWGAAFRVKGGIEEQAAMKYLEKRECEYDTKSSVDFHKEGDEDAPFVTGVLVFTSAPDKETNKYYLGPAPLEEMARQIATAHGPCGNYRDYIFLLEKAMYNIGHEDEYVIELANEVRKELAKLKEKRVASSPPAPKSHLPPHTPFYPPGKNCSELQLISHTEILMGNII